MRNSNCKIGNKVREPGERSGLTVERQVTNGQKNSRPERRQQRSIGCDSPKQKSTTKAIPLSSIFFGLIFGPRALRQSGAEVLMWLSRTRSLASGRHLYGKARHIGRYVKRAQAIMLKCD